MNVVPPAKATWMLRHLVLGDRNEALEGDLLEEFQNRRSARWYWRQVLGAILGFSNVVRAARAVLWTATFAGAWVCSLCIFASFVAHSPPQMDSANWVPYVRPGSILVVGIAFYLVLPLILYLALTHDMSLRAFAAGLGAGVLIIAVLPFFRSHLATPVNYFLAYGRSMGWNVRLLLHSYEVLQGSAPLLAAMWAAAVSKTKMSTADSPAPGSHGS